MSLRDESVDTADLVLAARAGDRAAFERIVERFEKLVWWVTREVGLDHATAADVSQTTWMRFVEHLDRIANPAGVASWLTTTARREAIAASRRRGRESPLVEHELAPTVDELDEGLLADERQVAVRRAFAQLDERCQRLLRLVTADPPIAYTEVADVMELAIGSIGPIRGRCINRLRAILINQHEDREEALP